MKAIILAAGIGSRLGNSIPKPLTKLKNNETILKRQVTYLSDYLGEENIIIVVGYKKDLIMEEFPNLLYVYNNFYDTTNTSKSLLKALIKIEDQDVLWLNGDVVFDKKLLANIIKCPQSCMAVNTNSVGEEEIKYNVHKDGTLKDVSKSVSPALGEAVGINKIISADLTLFRKKLIECNNQDYFEKAIELSIKEGLQIIPNDISDFLCMEIDFKGDLSNINSMLQ